MYVNVICKYIYGWMNELTVGVWMNIFRGWGRGRGHGCRVGGLFSGG